MTSKASSAVSTGSVVRSRHTSGLARAGAPISRATTTLISHDLGSAQARPVLGLAIAERHRHAGDPASFAWRARLAWGDRHRDFARRGETVDGLEQEAAVEKFAVAARPGDEIDVRRTAGEALVDVVLAVPDHHDRCGRREPLSRGLRGLDPAHGFLVLQTPLVAMPLQLG